MKEIAEELGLSRSTVSYALDHRWRNKRIGPHTRQLVVTRASELGYRRNQAAVSLKTRKTRTIGVIVPTIASDFSYQMLHGVESVIEGRYTLLLGMSDWNATKERRLVESFEERMIDGLLLISTGFAESIPCFQRLVRRGVPLVQVEHSFPEVESDVVTADNEGLGYMLARHLIELGHQRICFLRSPRVHTGTLARAAGYERAMRERGLEPLCYPQPPRSSNEPRFEFAFQRMNEILRTTTPPIGIIANDVVSALGAFQAVEDAGHRCPQEVSICSTNAAGESALIEGNPLDRFLRIRPTAAQWSVEEMGRRAAELLLQRMEDGSIKNHPYQRVLIPVHFVQGTSTARPQSSLPDDPSTAPGRTATDERKP
jgi:LacI family transcriptional regulator